MSYSTVQTAALSVLQKLSEFDSGNSSENDYRILGNGKSVYAVLRRSNSGDVNSGQIDIRYDVATAGKYTSQDRWVVVIELYVPIRTDALAARSLVTTTAETVLAHFDKYPNLDQTTGVLETDADLVPAPEEY